MTFNRPLEDPDFRILDPVDMDETKLVKVVPTADSARMYFEHLEFDSLKIEVSEYQEVVDTISLRKARNVKVDQTIVPRLNISNQVDRIKHIELSSSYPISSIDNAKILIMEDSVSRRNFQLQKDTINSEMYHIRFNWKPEIDYELVVEEGAIQGPFGETNEEFKAQFTLNQTENYGDIILKFTGLEKEKNYIVELIDESKEKTFDVRSLPDNHELPFIKYPGGKYSIRLIEDENGNGKWDGGDVYELRQAEPIWYLNRTFTIRANWEQNETIDVNFD